MRASKFLEIVVYVAIGVVALFFGVRYLLGLEPIALRLGCKGICWLAWFLGEVLGESTAKWLIGIAFILGGLWTLRFAHKAYQEEKDSE